jgi:hypothetical protein
MVAVTGTCHNCSNCCFAYCRSSLFLRIRLQALKSRAVDSSAAGRELAGAGADGLRYQDYTHHTPSSHVGEQPSVVSGQTQFGGQNFSGTHASMHWGVKDIPTPKEMVGALDDWVVGQPAAKRVSVWVAQQQDVLW